MQVHRDIDHRLNAKQQRQTGNRQALEQILGLKGQHQRPDDDEQIGCNQDQADQNAEFLSQYREDEVGVTVRQDALNHALARPRAKPAARMMESIAVST